MFRVGSILCRTSVLLTAVAAGAAACCVFIRSYTNVSGTRPACEYSVPWGLLFL